MVLCGTTLGLSPVLPTSQISAHSDLALPTVLLFCLSSYRLSAANRFWWPPLKVWHAQRRLSIIRRLTAAPLKTVLGSSDPSANSTFMNLLAALIT